MPQSDAAPLDLPATLDAACITAMRLQMEERLEEAGALYHEILGMAPGHATANYCFGMLQIHQRRPAEALRFLLTALESQPQIADHWLGYLEALLLTGKMDDAQTALGVAMGHGLSGAAVSDFTGRLACAREDTMRRLVEARRFDEARALARELANAFPDRGMSWKFLGALSWQDDPPGALAAMQRAAALLPDDVEAQLNVGLSLTRLERFDEAEIHLRRAIEIDPAAPGPHVDLGNMHQVRGDYVAAEQSIRRAIARRTAHDSDDKNAYSSLLFALSHNPTLTAEMLFAEHRAVGEILEAPLRAHWPQHRNTRDTARKIKVGLVSGDLCNHAVANYVGPLLEVLHHRGRMEWHAYYTNVAVDDVSRDLGRHFTGWHSVAGVSDAALAEKITADRIDILIDLAGHTARNKLRVFARKPAPIQASWIGYPGTTGLRAMDYFLADELFLPPGRFDSQFTEKLVYLPAQAPFKPHQPSPDVNRLPALDGVPLTFGSFNRPGKINASTVNLWSRLLASVPGSRMLLVGACGGGCEGRLTAQFTAAGVAGERLMFHPRCGMQDYLALHQRVDLCLDTFPYCGGTTSIHAAWMGVPTLTIAGSTPAARQGAAVLAHIGLQGFTADDADDFIAKGRQWAAQLPRLAAVRNELRGRVADSTSRNADNIAVALESALRHMWMRWCNHQPPESFKAAAHE